MKKIMCLLLSWALIGCGDQVLKADAEFANELLKDRFPEGASFGQVNSVFSEYSRSVELSRECETDLGECTYTAIGVIPAPGDHWWLGKGDIQIYFSFNEKEELESRFYEIYYPRMHQ